MAFFCAPFDDDCASSTDWTACTNKGASLICGLLGSDATAGALLRDTRNPHSAASVWSGDLKQELSTWYWHEVGVETYSCDMDEYWHIPFVMQSLGLNAKSTEQGGDNKCYRVEHWNPNRGAKGRRTPAINQRYEVGGKLYRSTKAHFEFGINNKGGAIFGFYLESPKHSARTQWYGGKRDADPADLPQLQAFSDVLWGFWNRDKPNIKNIRYFLMIEISNYTTTQIIASCLRKSKAELSEWPGTTFATTTDEGRALLGCPNGATFAYFLMQHKAELGQKTISKVTIFRPETHNDTDFIHPCLVFHVNDV